MFIDHNFINNILEETKNPSIKEVQLVLEKVKLRVGLTYKDIAILLHCEDDKMLQEIYNFASQIKKEMYGKRIVIFAPLYVSNYCINNCNYCGYKRNNKFVRRKLTMEELAEEVKILQKMGHKRLTLELGEDPINTPIEYVIDCINTVYKTQTTSGEIRRINVNVAATSKDNYKRLKEAKIGTYVLFQESYEKNVFENLHTNSVKGDYNYHLTAFDRAMEAGIDDVGGGVLFGLSDPKFEVLALIMHNAYLEEKYNVGFHTISVPRLKKANNVSLKNFPYLLTDEMFKKVVTVLRIAVPYTGLILSTRESEEMRRELLKYGVTQISAGSATGVGGYSKRERNGEINQFETSDQRSPITIIGDLLKDGYIPSYCAACYRKGRTGDRFMSLAKSGNIKHICEPNALMSLFEFILDYGDEELYNKAMQVIVKEIAKIEKDEIKNMIKVNIVKIKEGKRDVYL